MHVGMVVTIAVPTMARAGAANTPMPPPTLAVVPMTPVGMVATAGPSSGPVEARDSTPDPVGPGRTGDDGCRSRCLWERSKTEVVDLRSGWDLRGQATQPGREAPILHRGKSLDDRPSEWAWPQVRMDIGGVVDVPLIDAHVGFDAAEHPPATHVERGTARDSIDAPR